MFPGRLALVPALVAILCAPVSAEEALPPGVINVALPDFGQRMVGDDYGLANAEPVEVGQTVGRGQEIRIVRTPLEFRLSRRGTARFQILVGEVESLFFWIESPPLRGTWKLALAIVHPDGYREPVFGEDLLREGLYVARVPAKALLEFDLATSKAGGLRPGNWFRFTVSPTYIVFWDNYRPTPQAGQPHVILP